MEQDEAFFLGVVSFVVGIAAGSFCILPVVILLLCGSALGIAVYAVFPKKSVVLFGGIFWLWLFGVHLAMVARVDAQGLSPISQTVRGQVRVMTDPVERDFFRQVVVRFETCESGSCPETMVLWRAPLSSTEVEAGTRLVFACQLELPENFTPEFDYRMYLAKDGIGYVCAKAEQARWLPGDTAGRLRAALYIPKHVLEQALSQILTEPEAGLAKGLLLGGDGYLPRALKDSFTRIGLTHIIAVSGYNITLIAEMLLTVGLFLGLWRKQAVWAALFGVVFFIVMIGLPASALRAGTMAGIVFIALQSGRLAQPVNALLFAGGVMLLFNPLLFRYDLGFQLSFLATLGILWAAPYHERFAPRGVFLRKITEVVEMTGAVLLFVLPLSLFTFHAFSPLILVGNFLVLLVPFAMATSFLAAILFLLVPGAHWLVATAAFGLLTLITRSVEGLGAIGGARFVVEGFGVGQMVSWYLVLTLGVLWGQSWLAKKSYE